MKPRDYWTLKCEKIIGGSQAIIDQTIHESRFDFRVASSDHFRSRRVSCCQFESESVRLISSSRDRQSFRANRGNHPASLMLTRGKLPGKSLLDQRFVSLPRPRSSHGAMEDFTGRIIGLRLYVFGDPRRDRDDRLPRDIQIVGSLEDNQEHILGLSLTRTERHHFRSH